MDYVELHCHSNFSFLDGASHPEELVTRAKELGYPALALTDHNGLYGAVRFHRQAKFLGIKPIFGAEITLTNGQRVILLVRNGEGYGNLCQFLTEALLFHPKGEARVDEQFLFSHAAGLIALAGCRTEERACDYQNAFGRGHFFLELQNHQLPAQRETNRALARLGNHLGIPCVATNNVHFAKPEDRALQDILTCIRNLVPLDEAGTLLYPNGERHLKSPDQMKSLFAEFPEAVENTLRVAALCKFELNSLRASLPDFPVPSGETSFSYLYRLVQEGARLRYRPISPEASKQLAYELDIIQRLDLAGYFLTVWDIVRFSQEKKILCQGRGSAANSAVCYCLGITAVDPVRNGLLFERFLSEERADAPDIDLDFANADREKVIQYVYDKYGRSHAAMVCTVITYQGRSAIRDVGKALGFSLEQVDKLAKWMGVYDNAKELLARANEAGFSLQSDHVRLLSKLCRQIQGFPRHLGIHVGGMAITARPISEVVPVENARMPGRTVIQWDKDDVGELDLVKIDLLGLGMLTLIDLALKLIEEHRGIKVDPASMTFDDPRVYESVSLADTVGVFQLESRAQMNVLPVLKPKTLHDLAISIALIRPGPIQGEMVHPYMNRRLGKEPVTFPHPSLEPILKRTLGVPLFQEQGMRVAIVAAGFTPGEADELRRAMGQKRSKEKMQALAKRLMDGMARNGYESQISARIYKQLAAFADYGFPESHAISFAAIAYLSAYLRVYYPVEFYCALLNAQPMGFYAPATIVEDAKRHGIPVLDVEVNKSRWDCTVECGKLRIGYRYVRGMGEAAKERVEAEITAGPFVGLQDFIGRTRLSYPVLEELAILGAFSTFVESPRMAVWEIQSLTKQQGLKLEMPEPVKEKIEFAALSELEKVLNDYHYLGLSGKTHPMAFLRVNLDELKVAPSNKLNIYADGTTVLASGLVTVCQQPPTAKGFVFLTLEDEFGFINVIIRPQVFARYRIVVTVSPILLVKGKLQKEDGVINVLGFDFTSVGLQQGRVEVQPRLFR